MIHWNELPAIKNTPEGYRRVFIFCEKEYPDFWYKLTFDSSGIHISQSKDIPSHLTGPMLDWIAGCVLRVREDVDNDDDIGEPEF